MIPVTEVRLRGTMVEDEHMHKNPQKKKKTVHHSRNAEELRKMQKNR